MKKGSNPDRGNMNRNTDHMKWKKQWLWIALFSISVSIGGSVHAAEDVRMETLELTDENRYDSKYNAPIPVAAGSEQLSHAGTTIDEEGLEKALVQGWKNRESSIDVSAYHLPSEDSSYYFQVLSKHPELFYVNATSISSSSRGSEVLAFKPAYLVTDESKIAAMQSEIDAAVSEVLALITDDMEDYEKALVVHDWLAQYCEYDYENYKKNTIPTESYYMYGALGKKTAVCEGYTKAYQYLLSLLGIESYKMSSKAMNHAWNIVLLDGKYYHVDVTWDDPVRDKIGRVVHDYFLLSNDGICAVSGIKTHDAGDEYVAATDTTYEDAVWKDIDTAFVRSGNEWYAIDNTNRKLVSTADLLNGTLTAAGYSFDKWKTSQYGSYSMGFAYLQKYGNNLVFNGPKAIYKMNLSTKNVTTLYTPPASQLPEDTSSTVYNIYAFKISDDTLYYSILNNANLEDNIYSAAYPGLSAIAGSVEITGSNRYLDTLTAMVTLTGNEAGTLSYQWYRDGSLIVGANENKYVLTADDIGTEVSVIVKAEDCTGQLKAQTGTILKALLETPTEELKLEGERGKTLSCVELKEGYEWEQPDTVMDETGTKEYPVTYCTDKELYETVTGLTAEVTVSCGTHEFDDGEVTVEATTESTGIRTYHCKYCDYTKEETIPKLEEDQSSIGQGSGSGNDGDTGNESATTGGSDTDSGSTTTGGSGTDSGGATTGGSSTDSGSTTIGGSDTESGSTATGDSSTESSSTAIGESDGTTTGGSSSGQETGRGDDTTSSSSDDSREDVPGEGDEFTYDDTVYEITETEDGYEVSYVRPVSKKASCVIPDVVKYNGITYKVTGVSDDAFLGNAKLRTVKIGRNVTTIGDSAFSKCTALRSVTFGAKVSRIGESAFSKDKALTKVVLPADVKNIEKNAFYQCSKLKTIQFKGKTPPTISKNAFKGIYKKAGFKVPAQSLKKYKAKLTSKTGVTGKMKITK